MKNIVDYLHGAVSKSLICFYEYHNIYGIVLGSQLQAHGGTCEVHNLVIMVSR
jgi:hypothetical protein